MKENLKKVYIFGFIFLVLDQFLKLFINDRMVLYETIVLIKNFLKITLVYNTGAAFSILSGSRFFLITIGILAVGLVSLYVYNEKDLDSFSGFSMSLLLGGILGNLVDRIVYGYVIDYLSISIGSYNFPIFNFADICIVLSVIVILINVVKGDLWNN